MGNLGTEPVAVARDGFDKSRAFRGVAQGFAKPANRVVESVFEFDERILGPKLLLKLLACDDFPGMFEESQQNLQRLFVEFDADALLTQFS